MPIAHKDIDEVVIVIERHVTLPHLEPLLNELLETRAGRVNGSFEETIRRVKARYLERRQMKGKE